MIKTIIGAWRRVWGMEPYLTMEEVEFILQYSLPDLMINRIGSGAAYPVVWGFDTTGEIPFDVEFCGYGQMRVEVGKLVSTTTVIVVAMSNARRTRTLPRTTAGAVQAAQFIEKIFAEVTDDKTTSDT